MDFSLSRLENVIPDFLEKLKILESLPQYLYWFILICIYVFVALFAFLVIFIIFRIVNEIVKQTKWGKGYDGSWDDELKQALKKTEVIKEPEQTTIIRKTIHFEDYETDKKALVASGCLKDTTLNKKQEFIKEKKKGRSPGD